MYVFGSDSGGEADGDIDMDNYIFTKFDEGPEDLWRGSRQGF